MTRAQALTRASHHQHSVAEIVARRTQSVAVVVPARNEAATIERTVDVLVGLRNAGAIDRILVADDSTDDTPSLAERAGAEVVRQQDLRSEHGPVRGKGDAMWRALSIVDQEITCFVDADSLDFHERHPAALIGAIALDGYSFAKGSYRRPFLDTRGWQPTGGGRVTELTAKPLLAALFPALAAFDQPLAGEIALLTNVGHRLPMATGYAVDVALLIDVWRDQGLGRMIEVDLDSRQNTHRPLHELHDMAVQVSSAILARAGALDAAALAACPFEDRPALLAQSIVAHRRLARA